MVAETASFPQKSFMLSQIFFDHLVWNTNNSHRCNKGLYSRRVALASACLQRSCQIILLLPPLSFQSRADWRAKENFKVNKSPVLSTGLYTGVVVSQQPWKCPRIPKALISALSNAGLNSHPEMCTAQKFFMYNFSFSKGSLLPSGRETKKTPRTSDSRTYSGQSSNTSLSAPCLTDELSQHQLLQW